MKAGWIQRRIIPGRREYCTINGYC